MTIRLQLGWDDRTCLERHLALGIDESDHEVLVGLNRQESEWLLEFVNRPPNQTVAAGACDYYLDLYDRHEKRRQLLCCTKQPAANDG